MKEVVFEPSLDGWRAVARDLLAGGIEPTRIVWRPHDETGDQEPALLGSVDHRPAIGRNGVRVPRRFLALAAAVACHRAATRWDALYRVLWRLTGGEPHLLDIATDIDLHRILQMDREVRRAAHKMKAFVRFRAVEGGVDGTHYVAWFEPAHHVVQRTAPFFCRRFGSMIWSILTPDRCAHWDTKVLAFSPGLPRTYAPAQDDLEHLWRTYYAGTFNPARLNLGRMRAEMPVRYWRNLPEASLIRELARGAPRRVARMLAETARAPEPLPEACRADPAATSAGVSGAAAGVAPPIAPGWHPVHDPGLDAAQRRAALVARRAPLGVGVPCGGRVLVGIAGWTDPTLTRTGVFYPAGVESAEARLKHVASAFPLLEVDSTYYALPTRANAVAWAARTPDHFVFDIKAHGLMTGHGTDVRRLPDWVRRELPRTGSKARAPTDRLYARDLPDALHDEIWRRFLDALTPLREMGKLGAVLLQYPRWFQPSRESTRALERARALLGDVRGAVEFRHCDWLAERWARRALGLLESLGLSYVVVDGPQGMESSIPPRVAVTTPELAVFRLHGRRCDTWQARNDPATERYRYLYEQDELAPWADSVVETAKRAGMVHVIFNNCHGNYGATNAFEFTPLLLEGVRTSG